MLEFPCDDKFMYETSILWSDGFEGRLSRRYVFGLLAVWLRVGYGGWLLDVRWKRLASDGLWFFENGYAKQ